MYSWKFYVSIVRLRPFSSFLQRYKLKIWKICFRLVHYLLLPIFGLKGATDIGLDKNGCRTLRLNTNIILGNRGSLLHAPKDSGIYEHVRITGVWQEEEVKFYADQMLDFMGLENNCNLVDIGSNVGLFSLSVANLVSNRVDLTLVEPLPKFVQASKENLKEYESFLPYRNFSCCSFERDKSSTTFYADE